MIKEIMLKIEMIKKIILLTQQLKMLILKRNEMLPGNENLYKVAKSFLGKDMAPQEDELGCMEALNNIVKIATGKEIGGGTSTYRGDKAIKLDKRFVQVKVPKAGDVILSASGWGDARKIPHGHIGIIGDDGKIMSNRSDDGLWCDHWTLNEWKKIYGEVGRYPVNFYRLII